jgi:hypothetical protein
MDARIKFEGNITEESSYDLMQLANMIEQDCDLSVKLDQQTVQPGVKDSGLTIGLTIANLALTGIQSLISVLLYWESKQKKYSLLISLGKITYSLDNIKQEEADRILSEIAKFPNTVTDRIEIKITRK